MPTKVPYKVYPILLKTHKVTIFLEAPQSKTVASLKADALSALTSKAGETEDIPRVTDVSDFEICHEVKERGRAASSKYHVLEDAQVVQKVVTAWETLFIRFKDENGRLQPVEVTIPSNEDEDEEPLPNKGKGRAID